MSSTIRRREFLQMAAGRRRWSAAPTILTAKKTDSPVILGEGEHRTKCMHNWPQLPDQFTWQTTHDVAFDKAGNLYVIHEGHKDKPDHPAIFVFDADGKYIRSFGKEFQGGGHGLEVHAENGEEFLYVTGVSGISRSSPSSRSRARRFGCGTRRWSRASTPRKKTRSRPAHGAATGSCPRTSRFVRTARASTWRTATART